MQISVPLAKALAGRQIVDMVLDQLHCLRPLLGSRLLLADHRDDLVEILLQIVIVELTVEADIRIFVENRCQRGENMVAVVVWLQFATESAVSVDDRSDSIELWLREYRVGVVER